MRTQTTLLLSTPLLMLAACTTVHGDGELSIEDRTVGSFDSVEAAGSIEVEVTAGAEAESIEVTCDENLQEYILTEVKGDTLVIREQDRVSIKPTGTCVVAVDAATLSLLEISGSGATWARDLGALSELRVSGSGTVDVRGIDTGLLDAYISGSGDAELAGDATQLRLDAAGSGNVDARALDAKNVQVRASGSGDVWISASKSVDARVSGSGDVEIYGDPGSTETDATGSGSIIIH
jgi:hypothetical protein